MSSNGEALAKARAAAGIWADAPAKTKVDAKVALEHLETFELALTETSKVVAGLNAEIVRLRTQLEEKEAEIRAIHRQRLQEASSVY